MLSHNRNFGGGGPGNMQHEISHRSPFQPEAQFSQRFVKDPLICQILSPTSRTQIIDQNFNLGLCCEDV